MQTVTKQLSKTQWVPNKEAFLNWLNNRENILEPGLLPEPRIKILIFLALLDANKPYSYEDFQVIFKEKKVVQGNIPNNTLRTSALNLGRTLEKFQHFFQLKSSRGYFQLIPRVNKKNNCFVNKSAKNPVVILDSRAITPEKIASILLEKATLPFSALYFLEWSARWWEIFSSKEAEIRVPYEAGAIENLGIKARLYKVSESVIGLVGLAVGEGLAEIELLKKFLRDGNNKTIHYLAIDSSQRLLRNHIGLLQEVLAPEIANGKILCAGVVADIFDNLRNVVEKVRKEFKNREFITSELEFLPLSCPILISYLGNCLGNNFPDQETEIFSIIHSSFPNRPLECLVGVSVMQDQPDIYRRNWDDFLLQTPKHLLQTIRLFKSSRLSNSKELPEFTLPQMITNTDRCPPVIPESYIVRHQIEGQIYRFYYKLAFELESQKSLLKTLQPLPKGKLILLYNIIKYNLKTLVEGIKKAGLYQVKYDDNYFQLVSTPNGKRKYAVFSAYLEK